LEYTAVEIIEEANKGKIGRVQIPRARPMIRDIQD
jgi:hypothetical protein